jgi:cyclic pyranopterin phosphate synthase
MPEEGVPLQPSSHILSRDEIKQLAGIFVAQGVNKIRLTGGEPTIRKDIVEIVQDLKALGVDELAITSNGIALHRKLPELVESGVTALNLSLDTLQNGKFMTITRRNGLNSVMRSLERAMELGIKVKLNCVVIKGLNDDEILKFVGLAQHWAIEVRFIEYMPFDGNKWELAKVIPFKEMKQMIKAKYPSLSQRSHKRGETAKVYTCPDWKGSIGFITSMTDDFCGDCNRLRLTSDGNLKVCLFGNEEVSLRDMIRSNQSEDEIVQVIGRAVKNKKEKHAGLDELKYMKNRPMTLIGG